MAVIGSITRGGGGPKSFKSNLNDGKFLGYFEDVRTALQPFIDTRGDGRVKATRSDLPGNVEHYTVEDDT